MLTLTEAAEQIRTRRLSPIELTRECLSHIERLNPVLNAFITVTGDLALEQARQAEAEIMAGNYFGPLHGIPIGLKDLLDTAGVRTTAASNQFRNRIPAEDATLVRQLKAAGAVIVGKLNLHEFAFGVSGIVSALARQRTLGISSALLAAHLRVRPRQLPLECALPRSAQILRGPSAVRRRCAASSDIVRVRER